MKSFDACHLCPHYPLTGRDLHLVSVAKLLFNHICDVLKDVPSFQSEYGIILRHLLAVRDYRVHMRERVYCSESPFCLVQLLRKRLGYSLIILLYHSITFWQGLVILHIEKVQTNLGVKNSTQSNPKEDLFRCVLTLHSLLENPPGDFPNNLREEIIKGIVRIFSFVRYITIAISLMVPFILLKFSSGSLDLWCSIQYLRLPFSFPGMRESFRVS